MKQINIRGPIVSDDDKWIYDWFEMSCTTPKDFLAQLQDAGGEDVVVLINSVGGYVAQAAEIYEAIRSYEGRVTGKVVGQACSCASFIACAMYCEISPIGEVFIHNCRGGVEGDYRAMQQTKDSLLQVNDNIILAYQEKTGLPKEKLQQMMDDNTTLSAREAVRLGFVDKISENSNYETKIDSGELVAAAYGGMLPISNLSDQKRMALAAVARGMMPSMVGEYNLSHKKEGTMGKLSDFLASNPDANSEYQTLVENAVADARAEGAATERKRLEAIDQIADSISPDIVHRAKYAEPTNAETLALSALRDGTLRHDDTAVPATDASEPDTCAMREAAVNMDQMVKMVADYMASNASNLQAPPKDPLTGAAGTDKNAVEQMALDASASVGKYL